MIEQVYLAIMGLFVLDIALAALLVRRKWPIQANLAPVVGAAIIAGAGAVVGSIFNWLSNKSQANAQKAYNNMVAQLHNQWLATRSTEVKGILDELVARGQDIYGPTTTTMDSSMTSNKNYAEDVTPTITPEYQNLAGLQKGLVEKRLTSPTGLPAGYEEAGLRAINESAQPALNDIANLARKRGVSADTLMIGSPAERARLGSIADFRVETPLKARELQTQDIQLAQSLVEAFGRGQSRTGWERGTQVGRQTQTGPPDYSALAALLLTPGPQAARQA